MNIEHLHESVVATRYRNCGRTRAAVIGLATLIALVAGIWFGGRSRTALLDPIPKTILSDPELHLRIARRVGGGENYYDAAAIELRENGYGTRSIFNWRQPLYAWFLGSLPNFTIARFILALLGLCCIGLTALPWFRGTAPWWITLLNTWLVGVACFYCFVPWGIGVVESWAGVFILLSVFAYGSDIWVAGILLALLALFFRELAAPYVIVCVLFALRARRWREIGAWVIGMTLYGLYFAVHVHHSLQQIRASDAEYSSGWIQFGGIHFILETAAQTLLLLPLPLWVTGIFLALSLLGLFAMPGEMGRRLSVTVAVYIVMFAIVGKTFNDYWGFLYGPLIAYGLPWTLPGMNDLWAELRST